MNAQYMQALPRPTQWVAGRFRKLKQAAVVTRLTHLILIAAAGTVPCTARINRGTHTGLIADPSGAVVPGAVVMAIHLDTGTSASTVATDNGNYTPALPIGMCRVEYVAPGFKQVVRDRVSVAAGATIRTVLTLALMAPETKTAGGFRIGGGPGAGWEMMMDEMPTSSASSVSP
jgi:hypothetical protein